MDGRIVARMRLGPKFSDDRCRPRSSGDRATCGSVDKPRAAPQKNVRGLSWCRDLRTGARLARAWSRLPVAAVRQQLRPRAARRSRYAAGRARRARRLLLADLADPGARATPRRARPRG